jgi:monofunctional biosynthetic peptidoglycan transglycosylase
MPPARSSLLRRARPALLGAAAVLVAGVAGFALLWAALPDPAPLARETPRTTALIEQRRAEAKARRRAFHPRQVWVGLERISPRLVAAVLLSEDANFYGHEGIDWEALQEAARRDLEQRRFAIGGSTITQQLAKNLWFGTEKSLWRKAKEAVLATKLERALAKRRILALYLNVAEWDEGVFGAEAGARSRFGTSAAALDTAQAVVLASMLPAPRRVDLKSPSTWLKRRSRRLLDRMRAAGRISADEHLHASAELDRILAGPTPGDDREEPPDEEPAVVAAPLPASRPALVSAPAEARGPFFAPALGEASGGTPAGEPAEDPAPAGQSGGAGTAGQADGPPSEHGATAPAEPPGSSR